MNIALNADRFDDEIIIPTMLENIQPHYQSGETRKFSNAPNIDLSIYNKIILAISGGKDSLACLLALIEQGADLSKVELWHHDVDGREGSTLMDWTFMRDYNIKLAEHFDLPIYFSWLQGGFEGEMLKVDSFSQSHIIETPDGFKKLARNNKTTKRSKPSTRLKFPQQSASLATRWCSSAVKIDVGRRQITNQERFNHSNVLFITGERREESSKRATYNQLEYHSNDARAGRLGRRVDAWRPILSWSEEKVWEIIARHRIHAAVPYQLGWNRSSCMNCIYNDDVIWATIAHYFPWRAKAINDYEVQFNLSISRSKKTVLERIKGVKPIIVNDEKLIIQATTEEYFMPIALKETEHWVLPAGAFGKGKSGAD
jgi:3'-phosphoadenosine 5'-phosphosulfate sulfotransferase (PAPS reductase)/FAD synthetase